MDHHPSTETYSHAKPFIRATTTGTAAKTTPQGLARLSIAVTDVLNEPTSASQQPMGDEWKALMA